MNIAVVLAGGKGTRFGGDTPKQYLSVNGKMIISYVLDTLFASEDIDGIRIVCESEWREIIRANGKLMGFSDAGDNRQMSVVNALRDIRSELDAGRYGGISASDINVMILDAARPLVSRGLIRECFAALSGHDGVMPVLPMKDTVYMSVDGSTVRSTLRREQLFAGQAPEVFVFDRYYEACEALFPDLVYEINGTSEPAVMAELDVRMIKGDENNFKITTKQDFERFIAYLRQNGGGL